MPTMTDETPKLHRAREQAIRRLVEAFANTDQEMVKQAYSEEEDCYAFPMWGTLFRVEDSCDRRKIQGMLVDPTPSEDDDIDDLIAFADEHSIDVCDYADPCAKCEALEGTADEPDHCPHDPTYEDADLDYAGLAEHLCESWRESGDEDAELAMAGWMDVGGTGIIARDFGGDLYLGINGAGYSFYGNVETGDRSGHWPRLYDALGYSWEESGYRQDAAMAAARLLCRTEDPEAEAKGLALLRRRVDAADQGGPLTPEEIAECESINPYA